MSGKFHLDDDVSGGADPEFAERVRNRAKTMLDGAEEAIEARAGVLSAARDHPVAIMGIAFSLGFLLAGSGQPDRYPSVAKAKNQIKGAIMGGISAALSQQLRTFIQEQGGLGSLLSRAGIPVSGPDDDDYSSDDDQRDF